MYLRDVIVLIILWLLIIKKGYKYKAGHHNAHTGGCAGEPNTSTTHLVNVASTAQI